MNPEGLLDPNRFMKLEQALYPEPLKNIEIINEVPIPGAVNYRLEVIPDLTMREVVTTLNVEKFIAEDGRILHTAEVESLLAQQPRPTIANATPLSTKSAENESIFVIHLGS